MTLTWSGWTPYTGGSIYIDWSANGPGEDPINDHASGLGLVHPVGDPPDRPVFAGLTDALPVPRFAQNSGSSGPKVPLPGLPDPSRLPGGVKADGRPKIPDDTIIAGVIDVGIPLGHRRTRRANGKTRILAAWQMMGDWSIKRQPYLPFGCEFYARDLNRLLKQNSGGNRRNALDQDAFNTATGLTNMHDRMGQRQAAARASHGAHVMDVAAGCDPADDMADRVRIIAVNAPSSRTFGASGTYLDSYLFHGIQRIVDLADAIWDKQHPDGDHTNAEGQKGFAIVINMSFGKLAGSKDALDLFPAELARFQNERAATGRPPVFLTMPSGNDNLARCNAILSPAAGMTKALNWRIAPQDHSSSFTEVWVDSDGTPPLAIDLIAPQSALALSTPPDDGADYYRDLLNDAGQPVARIYAEHKQAGSIRKMRYTCCVAATHDPTGAKTIAPSGRWQVAVRNVTDAAVNCTLAIQTDQMNGGGRLNLQSYFDDPGYRVFDDTGRRVETFSFPPDAAGQVTDLDEQANTPVRRRGTMNASAAHDAAVTVGGYRATDGRPAPYSATGRGDAGGIAATPAAAFPTDDGPAHFGILAAGASDGSVVAMRGTSFASSQAMRALINSLMDGSQSGNANARITSIAANAETATHLPTPYSSGQKPVIGHGRIRATPLRPIPRL